jgi:hypothetical protein
MDNHSPVGISLQIRDEQERGALLVEQIAESRAIFPQCVYTNRREVRCGTQMLSLEQALEGSVLWLP